MSPVEWPAACAATAARAPGRRAGVLRRALRGLKRRPRDATCLARRSRRAMHTSVANLHASCRHGLTHVNERLRARGAPPHARWARGGARGRPRSRSPRTAGARAVRCISRAGRRRGSIEPFESACRSADKACSSGGSCRRPKPKPKPKRRRAEAPTRRSAEAQKRFAGLRYTGT